MKKIISVMLAITMFISAINVSYCVVFAEVGCGCCEDCSEDEACECGCDDCSYCGDGEYEEDDETNEDYDDESENEDDSNYNDVNISPTYNSTIEGVDPKETDTKYTNEEREADISKMMASQYCGESMFWYIWNSKLYIFGRGEMNNYASYNYMPWSGKSFDEVIIRTGITKISSYAFEGTDIKSVAIPSTVKIIGDNAFANCDKLETVAFGKDMQRVGNRAFYNCKSLKKLTINNGLEFLGESAFENCVVLNSVRFPSSLDTIDKATFKGCSNLRKAVLRTNLLDINDEAFYNCNMLSFVNFPDTIINIGNKAFVSCYALKKVYLGENLCRIGISAFANSGAESIVLKSNIKTIDVNSFVGCNADVQVFNNATVYKTLKSRLYLNVSCAQHDAKQTTKVKATFKKSGEKNATKCAACGEVISSKPIAQIFSISLSKSEFVYNGKAQLPIIKVIDINKKTIPSKYYTKKCVSGTKNVGTYSIIISFVGDYEGSAKLKYKIIPAKPTLTKLTALSKSVKVVWKKQTTQVTGFQIQYSTSSKFIGAKTAVVGKNSSTGYTIKNLAANKKCYVRIRTYKCVNGKNYYSKWSNSKSVKTK